MFSSVPQRGNVQLCASFTRISTEEALAEFFGRVQPEDNAPNKRRRPPHHPQGSRFSQGSYHNHPFGGNRYSGPGHQEPTLLTTLARHVLCLEEEIKVLNQDHALPGLLPAARRSQHSSSPVSQGAKVPKGTTGEHRMDTGPPASANIRGHCSVPGAGCSSGASTKGRKLGEQDQGLRLEGSICGLEVSEVGPNGQGSSRGFLLGTDQRSNSGQPSFVKPWGRTSCIAFRAGTSPRTPTIRR